MHLPENIDEVTIQAFGEEYIYLKRRQYNYSDLIKTFKEHEIFGNEGDPLYEQLDNFGKIRNRVHIENYHGSSERKEQDVWTEDRVTELEDMLETLFSKMVDEYSRPWGPRGSPF
jgi:hypothetical protein